MSDGGFDGGFDSGGFSDGGDFADTGDVGGIAEADTFGDFDADFGEPTLDDVDVTSLDEFPEDDLGDLTEVTPKDDLGNLTEVLTEYDPGDLTEDMPEDALGNLTEDMPEDALGNLTEDMPEDELGDLTEDVPEDDLSNATRDAPEDIMDDATRDAPEDDLGYATQDISEADLDNQADETLQEGQIDLTENQAEAQTDTQPEMPEANEALEDTTEEFLRFGELEPNTIYERNGYTYETDEHGRVSECHGTIQLGESHRTGHQTEVGHMGIDGDEGGHLFGAQFGGSPEGVNLVPQDMHLNRSDWKSMEYEWATALKDDKDVTVSTSLGYEGDTQRPSDFIVNYMIDGEPHVRYFPNERGAEPEVLV